MSQRAAALAALLLATVLACSGGLLLDVGNAYPCDFSLGEPERDQACPSGWICGVTNHCQQDADEGVLADSTPPTLGLGDLIAPTLLDEGVRGLARDPRAGRFVFAGLADGRAVQVIGSTAFDATPVGTFKDAVIGSGYRAFLLDGGTVRMEVGVITPSVFNLDLGAGTLPRGLRSYPGPPESPLQILFSGTAPPGLQTRQYQVSDAGFRDMPATAPLQLLDARPIPNAFLGLSVAEDFTSVALMVRTDDPDRRPQLYYRTTGGGAWVSLEDSAAPAVHLPAGGVASLRHSTNAEVWAAVLADPGLGNDVLAVWQLGFSGGAPQMSRAWKDCTPCNGKVRVFQPVLQGGLGVEVICEGADSLSRSAVRIQGSAATSPSAPCDAVPIEPPFSLFELASGDNVLSGQVTLGGTSGQIWVGDRISTLAPLFLDRVPEAIGSAKFLALDGGTQGYNLPFASGFFAVGGRGGDFPAFASTPDGVPRGPIDGTDNWVVMEGARIAKLQAAPPLNLVPYDLRYGPRLLDALGEPSAGPYHGDAVGDAGVFVVSGADSLYIYPVSALRTLPFSNPLDDLTPQLTPQAGAPIRSLALEPTDTPSDPDAGIHGYAISGSALFRFSRDGDPQHWDATRIDLSASEPVEVWSAEGDRKLGRVGFRDGSVFTLPGGLPMVDALPAGADGRPNRAFDFEAINGYPVCYAERGLYVARPVDGKRTLAWTRLEVSLALAAQLARPTPGRLARAPDGALLLFLDRGRVWSFAVGP